MATTRGALTESDVRMLLKGATADERAAAAYKLCRAIEHAPLTAEDRAAAADILRVMAADAAEVVRRALAVTLKASPLVPRDVALGLASDVESICLPILNFSPAFTDADLVEIVRLGGPVRQLAIARRPTLSTTVTDAIVEHGEEPAVQAACANENAAFAEGTLDEVLVRFSRAEQVLQAVAYRNALPLSVAERLVHMVGEAAREHILSRHPVSPEVAAELIVGAQERATVDLVDQAGRTADLKEFVQHLHRTERLTASLLVRALANGHMAFFEWGVAELAGVPHHRTWLMIHDAGPLGLRAIYDRAGLPARLFPAVRAAVDTFHALELEGGLRDCERFQERMLQRFLTQPASACRQDVDYLLEKMDRLPRRSRAASRRAVSA